MLWRSGVPVDMAVLIETLRLESLVAHGGEQLAEGADDEHDEDDWDEGDDRAEMIDVGDDDPEDGDLGEQ